MAFEGRRRSPLGREDLPEHFTPENRRALPIGGVRLLRDPRNGVLSADEQAEFDRALDEVMGGAGRRVHGQLTPVDLARLAGRGRQRRGGPGGMRRDETLDEEGDGRGEQGQGGRCMALHAPIVRCGVPSSNRDVRSSPDVRWGPLPRIKA